MKTSRMKTAGILKVAHYNILGGGAERQDAISGVIKEINPDICGLLEAVGWENDTESYRNKFKEEGYDYFYFAKANSKYNIAVISKMELEPTIIKEGIRHVILGIKIEDGQYAPMQIYFVHLSPVGEEERLKELSVLFENIGDQKEVVVMGDFNSLSERDDYDREKLLLMFQKNNIAKYGTGQLRFDVINKMEKEGFIDTFRYMGNDFDYTVPTRANSDINHTERLRIDYAFIKGADKIKDCLIHKSRLADIASDHYPMFIDIEKSSDN